jgi:hypothetical protein
VHTFSANWERAAWSWAEDSSFIFCRSALASANCSLRLSTSATEGTGAGLLGGGGGAAVWTTLGLALREKRDRERQREVREGGGKEEGTSEDTICLSNKEMHSVSFSSLA